MTLSRLLLHNLRYHWRGNLAVCLGVAVGSAVLTGALLVGDSLRGSLRDLALRRLGWVDYSLVAGRFIRQDAAEGLPAERACPVLLLQATAAAKGSGKGADGPERHLGRVVLLGVDECFWPDSPPVSASFWNAAEPAEVVLSAAFADGLNVAEGDEVTFRLQKPSAVPRESLLGRRSDVVEEWKVTVRAVLPADDPGSEFSLAPSPTAPRNAFVPLRVLQEHLIREEGRNNSLPPRPINAILAKGGTAGDLQAQLGKQLTLDDWGLVLLDPQARLKRLDRNGDGQLTRAEWTGRVPRKLADAAGSDRVPRPTPPVLSSAAVLAYYERLGYLSLESRRQLLDDAVGEAAKAAAEEAGLRAAPTLVYIANGISAGKQEVPYAIIAALDPAMPPPLGPFLPAGVDRLKDDEIIFIDWMPLQVQPGEQIRLEFFSPDAGHYAGSARRPVSFGWGEPGKELQAAFRYRGTIPLHGVADDPDLAPEFSGITDTQSIGEWDPPPPFNRKDIQKRIGKRDEDYWHDHRTTPKAYVTLAAGQELWGSRFGNLTSVRLAPAKGQSLAQASEDFRRRLLEHLRPEQGGLVFDNVRERSLEASAGGTDFSGLFLGFSFFLIAAALLLVGLLFRLNLERRASEVGLLLAAGYPRRVVRRLLVAEGTVLAATGSLMGLGGAVLYGWLLLRLLQAWWPGELGHSLLRLHVTAPSLAIGYFASVVVGVLTILWAVRILGRLAPRSLLAGDSSTGPSGGVRPVPRWARLLLLGGCLAAVALSVWGTFASDHTVRAMMFFGSGTLLLATGLAFFGKRMHAASPTPLTAGGAAGIARLGARNAARHPVRSLLTAGLLAAAAFLLIAVDSFRQPSSGGFGSDLLVETDLPIFVPLGGIAGQEGILDRYEQRLQQAGVDPARLKEKVAAAQAALPEGSITSDRLRSGDDASCLNLYQPKRPRIVGVPFPSRAGPEIVHPSAELPHFKQKQVDSLEPLHGRFDDGSIPVMGDENTVVWMLKSGIGQTIEVPDEQGRPARLRVVGLLKHSFWQSELLMSEANFLRLYPGEQGYRLFRIQSPSPKEASEVLRVALADHGVEVITTAERLAAYHEVENTYLSMFQALGGLGLLLGASGLAVVLLRGVWERRGELALLRALGYRHSTLGLLVLAENAFLLVAGLAVGTVAALVAVAPHLLAEGSGASVLRIVSLLALVVEVGLVAAAWALHATLKVPLVPALRRE